MQYIESPSHDAYFNMALEEYVFDALPKTEEYFMLWQNENAIVVGKYQNTAEEINSSYVREHGISVVRRLSGGGAMYQDMGNLNFTFVVNQDAAQPLDFGVFIRPVMQALHSLGVQCEHSSRNDITIGGKKFSGNSQYNRQGRTMHHGTLLFDSNPNVIGDALRVKPDKIASKGVKSVRSYVTNIREHLEDKISLEDFKQTLLREMFGAGGLEARPLDTADMEAIHRLRDAKYATWDWNYGKNPPYDLQRERRYPFGRVTLRMQVEKGVIRSLHFSGDFFGNGSIDDLAGALEGVPLKTDTLRAALEGLDIGHYIRGMDADQLEALLLEG